MKAAVETLEAGVKAKLHDLESDAESPNILLARMNIPAYSFVQKEKSKANILDKSPKSFLHILKVIVESGKADAIEKRLKADAFTPKMLEACEGLVNVTTEETWSVTKKKV